MEACGAQGRLQHGERGQQGQGQWQGRQPPRTERTKEGLGRTQRQLAERISQSDGMARGRGRKYLLRRHKSTWLRARRDVA